MSCKKGDVLNGNCGKIVAKEIKGTGGPEGSRKMFLFVEMGDHIEKVSVGILDYSNHPLYSMYCLNEQQ